MVLSYIHTGVVFLVWGLLLALEVIAGLLIFGFLLEKGINKLLGVEKKNISETPARRIDRRGRGVILVIVLLTLPVIITKDVHIIKWYWIVYFLLLFGFQAFLEWKYLKETKQYITTLIFFDSRCNFYV